mgnify:CR=1 FL=1
MLRFILMIATFASPLLAQEIVLSGNPNLLFSTANLSGPWGGESFINSPNNPNGPLGGSSFLGSFTNENGVGITAERLSKLTPYIPFIITPDDILDAISIRPLEISPLIITPVAP